MTPAVLDISLLVIMLLSTGLACWRGFVRELFTIIGFGAAGMAAWKGGHLLVPVFNGWLGVDKDGGEQAAEMVSRGANADAATHAAIEAAHSKAHLILGVISPALMAKICAYGAAFLCVFILMSMVSYVVTRSVQEMGLGIVDKIVGAAFGFTRGFLMIFLPYVVFFVMMGKNTEKFPDWAKNSASVPLLQKVYESADRKFDIGARVQDEGDVLALKFHKGESPRDEALREEIAQEEAEREKRKQAAP